MGHPKPTWVLGSWHGTLAKALPLHPGRGGLEMLFDLSVAHRVQGESGDIKPRMTHNALSPCEGQPLLSSRWAGHNCHLADVFLFPCRQLTQLLPSISFPFSSQAALSNMAAQAVGFECKIQAEFQRYSRMKRSIKPCSDSFYKLYVEIVF